MNHSKGKKIHIHPDCPALPRAVAKLGIVGVVNALSPKATADDAKHVFQNKYRRFIEAGFSEYQSLRNAWETVWRINSDLSGTAAS